MSFLWLFFELRDQFDSFLMIGLSTILGLIVFTIILSFLATFFEALFAEKILKYCYRKIKNHIFNTYE